MKVAARFRRRLRKLILSKYRSLDRFYLETDFSKGHLSENLRGKGSPSVSTLIKLAEALDVEICDFFIFPERSERDRAIEGVNFHSFYRDTARSQASSRTLAKFTLLTARRMSSPVIGTIKTSSRLPRNVSFITVVVKPFQETRNPIEHLRVRFSTFCLKITNSSLPHFAPQFLHSASNKADSRRSRGEKNAGMADLCERPLLV
ncbi:helix-turn-helix domain-containing protein [Candidatus Binatus sp.]|jgi:transcriptional regulator with XRE-family HTH domain|uniref:helix-turn-helix domain-containing protein n=1 Tax=Candidatus Binatus sp. TaxID=2811406 RepID=UPI003C3B329D